MNKLQESEFDEVVDKETDNTDGQSYEIKNLEDLTWAFRKLSYYQSKKAEKQKISNAERERINEELSKVNAWEEKELKSTNDSISNFESIIANYHSTVLAEDPDSKTLSTPYGKVKSTTSKAQPDKGDEEKLLAFIKKNKLPFVKTIEEIKWGDLKKTLQVVEKYGQQIVIDKNGETVPGATVKPQTTTFKVEIE